jgi:hypothetical protein
VANKLTDRNFWEKNVYRMLRDERRRRTKNTSSEWLSALPEDYSEAASCTWASFSENSSEEAAGVLSDGDSEFYQQEFTKVTVEKMLGVSITDSLGEPSHNIYRVELKDRVIVAATLRRKAYEGFKNWDWRLNLWDRGRNIKQPEKMCPMTREQRDFVYGLHVRSIQVMKVYHNVQVAQKEITIL